ncbi:MAG: deoxyribonuclease [Petroclostridium sp.]|jgi:deoxyribonuclease-4|uniref:TIM barrel protein n=1 Tax=Petroclostridium xylanilyticum TaxID=1792311 RepID=UPI000B9817E9|nr:TIM barrel protein [Petroclostridium xylanilyticum]MBZ4644727.1 endonuclease [Clostridia bacterium]MDK2811465.1 deoxyribonuclease [Petroclostridium sp.]
MAAKFGPSGNSDIFYEQGYKSSLQMPEWLKNMGLDAYEYQCSKGVNISEKTAKKLGENARAFGIELSVHAPYYINLASIEAEKREGSKRYIIETMTAARWMGAKRVVVHPGSCSKINREAALELAKDTLKEALKEADALGLDDIHICPETLGKINQLGTLEEVMELCKIDERLIPTIDFGHIHARGLGCLVGKSDFEKVFDIIENSLGSERLKNFHSHFSRIEFTSGGEKKHWSFCDIEYGPEFEPVAEIVYKRNLSPVIICESRGTMAEDALELKKIYMKKVGSGE